MNVLGLKGYGLNVPHPVRRLILYRFNAVDGRSGLLHPMFGDAFGDTYNGGDARHQHEEENASHHSIPLSMTEGQHLS